MDGDLMERLLFAESSFLVALQNGPHMLSTYRETLSTLPNALSTATKTAGAQSETLSLAHSVASRILNIASCYLHVKHQEESFSAQLRIDCDAMLHQMDALNLDAKPKSSSLNNSPGVDLPTLVPPASLDAGSSSTPFLGPVHGWLLDNIHNPYPTLEVKVQIASASSCRVSSISSWFVNARRRIGWTTLCRERFSNCRADMIDAAYRALVEEDPQRALPPDLRHSFVEMKVAAEGLYPSSLSRSTLAGDLDSLIKDMTQKDGELEGSHQVERASPTKRSRDSYPSPDQSVAASPVSALVESVTDESEGEDVAPPVIVGSKRRRSSAEPGNESSCVGKPIKRLRTSATSQAHLPSPPLTTDSTPDDCPPEPSSVFPTQCKTNNALPSRKQRFSDADATAIPQRPRSSMAGPRLHFVSDSRTNTENEYSIDDWFNTNFDALFAIPPPVDATIEPDLSPSCEVELFRDYNIPGESTHITKPPASAAGTQISAPTDLSDLDNLLHSIGSDTFITPLHNAPASDVTDALHTASFDSLIPDISQTSIDWTSLLNDTEVYEPTIYSTFSQYPTDPQPLPEIDLSMLQLPHVMPAASHQEDFASKQAKLHQLQVMQEAVRRMEQELQAEGIVI